MSAYLILGALGKTLAQPLDRYNFSQNKLGRSTNLKGIEMALRDPRTASLGHQQARNPDPSGSRSHGDPTDMVGDHFHVLAREQLIPQIANRTRNAISVDRREIFLYQRLRAGRRCQCWSSGETQAHAQCPICFSTGFAGGFHKVGTELVLFDPSVSWTGVNAYVNPKVGIPPWFSLEDGHTEGYVEWTVNMERANYFGIDSCRFEYKNFKGASIRLEMKLVGTDLVFVPFTQPNLLQRVLAAGGAPIKFRVTMTRTIASDNSPFFLQFWFRALVNDASPPVIYVDIPRRNESNVLVEYGALETFVPIQFAFSDTVQRVNNEDVIVRLFDMTRWKVIEESPNDPLNILTSHDVQGRKVFQHEAFWNIPL